MRMSCNSTWLLDHETDFGHKADELMTLLEELFQQPEAKAVVFSQWLGTHEVLMRRLRARGWDHVLFHGGVPGDKRGALVDRFAVDPGCRLFLSTDAGGVGLNLQHAAATVVNMDLPWNPAKLEQRIGRVHRIGQRRGVQVINLVAQGSIEEGMLGVLAFKKSLFAGVLDGGDSAVFMNGTRLAKFMESVDEVTGAMGTAEEAGAAPVGAAHVPAPAPQPSAEVEEAARAAPPPAEVAAIGQATEAPASPAASPATSTTDPWAPLLEAGLRWIESLHESDAPAAAEGDEGDRRPRISTDPRTGARSVTLPLPDPATVQRLAEGLTRLLAGLGR
jgi:hypothetical protein